MKTGADRGTFPSKWQEAINLDCFRAFPLWRKSETVAAVHSGMQSMQWGDSGICLKAACVQLRAYTESKSNSSELTFHFPAPSLFIGEHVTLSIKPLLLLENEHSVGSRSETAINNKPADKDTVTGFDLTSRQTLLNAAGGEDGYDSDTRK